MLNVLRFIWDNVEPGPRICPNSMGLPAPLNQQLWSDSENKAALLWWNSDVESTFYAPHVLPPSTTRHTPPPHTRLQPVAWSYSWNPKTAFPFLLKHFSPSAGQTLWHCGRCCPIRPCGLCCTLTQGAREPGGGCTSQPFGVLLLRVRFASDESTINSRKDWGVCWFARIARRWTFG